jgi:methionine sulfoxide reductase heme-binding subunit
MLDVSPRAGQLAREEKVMASRWFPLLLAALLAFGGLAFGFVAGADNADQWLLASRYTARVSFPIFLLTYCASSLMRLWPVPVWKAVLRHRRQWGLGFAFAHTVHLGALAWFNVVIQNMPGLQALLGGGLAYGLMYLMALTSNSWSMKRLGVWWKRLHIAGIHWIWVVFTFSYFGRLFDPERWMQGAVLFPLCIAALGLRIAAAISARKKRAQPQLA